MNPEERALLLVVARILYARLGGPSVTEGEHDGHLLAEALRPFEEPAPPQNRRTASN